MERELAGAGKLFSEHSSPFGGSATSSFPRSSSLTPSIITVESWNSDDESEYNERAAAHQYEYDSCSEVGSTTDKVDHGDTSTKQIGKSFLFTHTHSGCFDILRVFF